jgi:hypothetical protein
MAIVAAFTQIFSGLGLSSAAGLNAYVPLLAVGILGRMGIVHLEGPYALLASTVALAVLGVLAAIDFIADKVPAVDHATHAVGAIINPVAGAIVFGSQTHALGHIPPALALGAGLIVAGGFHATRAAVRPIATVSTGGIANPIVSLMEDIIAIVMSLLAIFLPFAAFLLFLVLVVALYKSWGAVRRGAGRLLGGNKPGPAVS